MYAIIQQQKPKQPALNAKPDQEFCPSTDQDEFSVLSVNKQLRT